MLHIIIIIITGLQVFTDTTKFKAALSEIEHPQLPSGGFAAVGDKEGLGTGAFH